MSDFISKIPQKKSIQLEDFVHVEEALKGKEGLI